MISNCKFQIPNCEKGITIVEIVVVIFIVAMFSVILISDFPEIQRQHALSRASYKLAQNLRRVEDLALSGVKIKDSSGNFLEAKGYGVYIDTRDELSRQQYIVYADSCLLNGKSDDRYTFGNCQDYIIETVNVNEDRAGVFIKSIENIDTGWTSVNFSPPNPDIKIEKLSSGQKNVEIVLSLLADPEKTRSVSINMAGLIEVK